MLGAQFLRVQRRFGWPLLVIVSLAVVILAATTTILMLRADESPLGGASVGRSSGGAGVATDMVAPEENSKLSLGAPQPAVAPNASGATDGGTGTSLPTLDADRAIIRTGSVDLEVRSVTDAFDQVRAIATGAGGFVADSMFIGSGKEHSARLTIRVPADRFGEVVTQLRGLATEVRTVSSSSRDVTAETSDLDATLKNLRAVEAQYATLLTRAGSIGDILQVQERLNSVRLQIDRTEARRSLLRSQTEMSTLSVSLVPEGTGVSKTGARNAVAEAWQASLDTLTSIGTTALVVVVYSWWIVLIGVPVSLVAWRRWRRAEPVADPVV